MKTTAFKNTDIGPIPEDWEVKKLGDLMSFKNGFNAPAKAYGQGVPFVSVLDILAPFPITAESILGKVNADASALNSFSVETGDLLFMRSSETQEDIGRSNVFVDSISPVVFGGFVIRGRPFAEVDSVFLNYLLKDNAHRTRVSAKGAGAQHFNIGQIGLADVEITLPPLSEQRRIAAALSDADELVASLDKLIEKKKRVKEGAMQRLLSGETRLPGFGGKKFKQTDLGSIPGDWELKKLGEILQIGNGKDYKHLPEGDVPVYGTGGLMTYVNEFLHEGETVCIGRKGTIDEPQYHEGRIWTVDTLFYTYDFDGIVPKFFFYLSKRIDWQSYNTATGVPSLTAVAIQGIPVKVPPLSEQRAIAAVLSDMDAEIAALSRERAEAARIKQGMMQELLTGKTRLAEGE